MSEKGTGAGMSIAEARGLGRELARTYRRAVVTYKHLAQISSEEAIERTDELLARADSEDLLQPDPENISWLDLASLADSGESLQAWERIQEEAEFMQQAAAPFGNRLPIVLFHEANGCWHSQECGDVAGALPFVMIGE